MLRAGLGRLGAALETGRRRRLAFHGARVALALALAGLTSSLFPASPAVEVPIYEVGSVARGNVIAPFAFTIPKPEAALDPERDDLLRWSERVFSQLPGALEFARRHLPAILT